MRCAYLTPESTEWIFIEVETPYCATREYIDGWTDFVCNFANLPSCFYSDEDAERKKLKPNFNIYDRFGRKRETVCGTAIMFGPKDECQNPSSLSDLDFKTTLQFIELIR